MNTDGRCPELIDQPDALRARCEALAGDYARAVARRGRMMALDDAMRTAGSREARNGAGIAEAEAWCRFLGAISALAPLVEVAEVASIRRAALRAGDEAGLEAWRGGFVIGEEAA